jgi:hypothetical protein
MNLAKAAERATTNLLLAKLRQAEEERRKRRATRKHPSATGESTLRR